MMGIRLGDSGVTTTVIVAQGCFSMVARIPGVACCNVGRCVASCGSMPNVCVFVRECATCDTYTLLCCKLGECVTSWRSVSQVGGVCHTLAECVTHLWSVSQVRGVCHKFRECDASGRGATTCGCVPQCA